MSAQTHATQSRLRGQGRRILLPIAALAVLGCFLSSHFPSWLAEHSASGAAASQLHLSALSPEPSASGDSKIAKPNLVASYGKLPLAFESNQGQTNSRVKFVSRGQGYTIFLTSSEAVLALRGQKIGVENLSRSFELSAFSRPLYDRQKSLAARDSASVLRLKLVGATLDAKVTGLDELPVKSNYFIGNDPKKWRTNVPNYARVKYQNVYPGIDLVYYGNQGQLEYDFVVAPGADVNAIVLALEYGSSLYGKNDSVKPLGIDAEGDLVVKISDGEVRFHKPIVYQPEQSDPWPEFRGELQHPKLLEGRYVLLAENRVRFEIPEYDRSRTLIIDPVLSYSTLLGGSNLQYGSAIAVDSSGSAYVTGFTESSDFPTMNPLQPTCRAALCGNAFVAKLNAAGTALVYSTFLGGSGQDRAYGIAVDTLGNAYVMGGTFSTDFPTVNPFQAKNAGGSELFVSKLNAMGNALVYSTYLGGSGDESTPGFAAFGFDLTQGGIAVDSAGNAYVAGYTNSTNFPTANAFQAANAGGYDAFVSKFNAAGNALVYSTYLGGASDDAANGIAVDSAGNAYVTGETRSTGFPTLSGFQNVLKGFSNAFVTKLAPVGNTLVYSTLLGGSGADFGNGLAVDSSNNAYVTGETSSTDFPTLNPFQATCGAVVCDDAFVTKVNSTGGALVYSTYLGGNAAVFGASVAVDSSGNAYVTGKTTGDGLPTLNPIQASYQGNFDAFVTEFNAAGNTLVYSTYLGGSGEELAGGIAVDSSGNAYVTGGTAGILTGGVVSNDFPTLDPIQGTCIGTCSTNVFVSKISPANVAAVSLAPTAIGFANQFVNTTSAAQTITLRNVGSAALTISNISITGTNSGDFALASNNCGAGLTGGGSCSLTVTFTPKLVAVETAAITVTDNATGSPQSATLTGKGVNPPVVSLSPTSLAFGDQLVGTTSATKTVTVTNTGGSPLTGIAIGITGAPGAPVTGDFSGFETCSGSPLAVGASCTQSVNFTPLAAGARADRVFINDNAPNSPQYIPLSGTGIQDFGIAVAPGSSSTATVTAGGTATFTLSVTPQQATVNQTVTLGCTGAPSLSTCTPSPSNVTLNGTNAAPVTVTVTTTAPTLLFPPMRQLPPVSYGPVALWLLVTMVFAVWSIRRKRTRQPAYLLLGLVLIAVTFAACGGGGGGVTHMPGTPAGTYTLTVTGASGSLSHNTTLKLTVQ